MDGATSALPFVLGSFLSIIYLKIKQIQGPLVHKLRIGTRKSDLAMIQTRHIVSLLKRKFPHLEIEIVDPMEAIGDKILNQHLKELSIQSPGLFTKGLETGLMVNRFDCIVHSLKDMPTRLPPGMCLAAVTKREDERDVVVFRKGLLKTHPTSLRNIENLENGSIIGTSSIRREAILKQQLSHKNFNFKLIRGNVNRRLQKLDEGQYDATILAAAGLKRLGKSFENRITQYLKPPRFLYGVSQGALGLECRKADTQIIRILKSACADHHTTICCKAERAVLRTLEGGCQLPLGISSTFDLDTEKLTLHARILNEDGSDSVEQVVTRKINNEEEATETGEELARNMLLNGGKEILKSLRSFEDDEGRQISRPLTYGSAENPNIAMRPESLKFLSFATFRCMDEHLTETKTAGVDALELSKYDWV